MTGRLIQIGCLAAVFLLCLNGCERKDSSSIINQAELSKIMHTDEVQQSKGYEMVKLQNGMIVYKDNVKSKNGSDQKSFGVSKPIQFGPRDIYFGHNK